MDFHGFSLSHFFLSFFFSTPKFSTQINTYIHTYDTYTTIRDDDGIICSTSVDLTLHTRPIFAEQRAFFFIYFPFIYIYIYRSQRPRSKRLISHIPKINRRTYCVQFISSDRLYYRNTRRRRLRTLSSTRGGGAYGVCACTRVWCTCRGAVILTEVRNAAQTTRSCV